MARNSQAEGSIAARPTIPSGSRAIDEGTPVYSTVEDANDRWRSDGIQNPSDQTSTQRLENLETAQ